MIGKDIAIKPSVLSSGWKSKSGRKSVEAVQQLALSLSLARLPFLKGFTVKTDNLRHWANSLSRITRNETEPSVNVLKNLKPTVVSFYQIVDMPFSIASFLVSISFTYNLAFPM